MPIYSVTLCQSQEIAKGSIALDRAILPFIYSSNSIDYFLSQHSFFSAQSAFFSQQAAESFWQQAVESLTWQQESVASTATDSTVSIVVVASSPSEAVLAVLFPEQENTANENVTAIAAKNNLVFILS